MDYAFKYAETSLVESEVNYPYKGHDDECLYDASKGVVKVMSFQDVPANNPKQLKAAIAKGPVSVGIQADSRVFQLYHTGVITSAECGTEIDHGVLAVGYGKDGDQEYVIVKNSWGAQWGDQGYVKIGLTEGEGICGINKQAS